MALRFAGILPWVAAAAALPLAVVLSVTAMGINRCTGTLPRTGVTSFAIPFTAIESLADIRV